MIRIFKEYDSAIKLKKGIVYITPLGENDTYSNNCEEWYTISIEEYEHHEIIQFTKDLKEVFKNVEFIYSNYSVQYYNKTKADFLNWINSDNVIKLKEDKYSCQCIQYKKQFTLSQLYKYFIKEYIDIN